MILIIQNDKAVSAGTFETYLSRHSIPFTVWSIEAPTPYPDFDEVDGVITLGGFMGVHQIDIYPEIDTVVQCIKEIIDRNIPHLAICLGAQLLAYCLGEEVYEKTNCERGCCEISLTQEGLADPLFASIESPVTVLQWHHDSFDVPDGAVHLAASTVCPGQAFRYGNSWGVQFHPEVDEEIVAAWTAKVNADPCHLQEFHRKSETLLHFGETMLENFLRECGVVAI